VPEDVQDKNDIIVINTRDAHFADGFQKGYLDFVQSYQGTSISDEEIHTFIAANIYDVRRQNRYNSGYVLGWVYGLFQDYRPIEVVKKVEALILEA